MAKLHFYMNNPTAGDTDGTEISNNTNVLPLTLTLDASKEETQVAKCAVRCDSGYSISGGASIYGSGDNSAKWQFALDNNFLDTETALTFATWQDSIVAGSVGSANVIFWAKATSSSLESPQNDRTVKINGKGLVVVAEPAEA